MMKVPPIPLSGWADAELQALASLSGSREIASLSASTLLGERAALGGFTVPNHISAGGGCRIYSALDGHVALNLSRPDDCTLLPALFGVAAVRDVAAHMARAPAAHIAIQGRTLGLAIANLDEMPASPACALVTVGLPSPPSTRSPLVVDLSALWAGPLSASLLRLAGAQVVKVESRSRPDAMRIGDPALFARLNQGKANVALDLRAPSDRDALIALVRRAQFVVEASRPRALAQLGIDAAALVREVPGLVWITITGHGVVGDAANWIGFGDDCSVAGGLSAALRDATGAIGFAGDACADPLTGIHAARMAIARCRSGQGGRLVLSMSGVVAAALAAERLRDAVALAESLGNWAEAVGRPFPAVAPRAAGHAAAFGEDNDLWIEGRVAC